MAGKRQKLESKIAEKKDHPRMKKMKIDPNEEKENVKFFSSVLAEQVAVQEELKGHMDTALQEPSVPDTLQDLLVTNDLLRNVNSQAVALDAAIRQYIDDILAVSEADESKGK